MVPICRPGPPAGDPAEVVECARRLLGVPGPGGRTRLAAAADAWPHKFGLSLLTAWQACGESLDPAQTTLVRAAAERHERHRAVTAALCRAVPGLWQLKGRATSRLYPPGVLRQETDVDLCAPTEAELWAAARELVDRGWAPASVVLRAGRDGRGRQTMVSLLSAPPELDQVEITTDPLDGDHWGADSRPLDIGGTDSASLALVMLVEEGTGRWYGLRDIYDALVLLRALAATGTGPVAAELIAAAGLAGQWERVLRGVERSGLGPGLRDVVRPPAAPPPPRTRTLRRPVRWGILGAACLVRRYDSEPARKALTRAQAMLGARWCYRARIGLFGTLLPGAPDAPAPVAGPAGLRFAGPLGLLSTPVGDFALSIGGDIPAEWVERAG